jgi:hypothetical protein
LECLLWVVEIGETPGIVEHEGTDLFSGAGQELDASSVVSLGRSASAVSILDILRAAAFIAPETVRSNS